MEKPIRLDSFVLVPPMSGVEDQNICPSPLLGVPVKPINHDGHMHTIGGIPGWAGDGDEKRRPVVFHCEVVFAEADGEEALVLAYRASIFLEYCGLVRYGLCKHANQRLPLVSP
jgi:hypothetical protein